MKARYQYDSTLVEQVEAALENSLRVPLPKRFDAAYLEHSRMP